MILYTNILILDLVEPESTFIFADTANPISATGFITVSKRSDATPNFYKNLEYCKKRADNDTSVGQNDFLFPGPSYIGAVATFEVNEVNVSKDTLYNKLNTSIVHWETNNESEHYSIVNPKLCNIRYKDIVYVGTDK